MTDATRQRMVFGAIQLFRRHGYTGTGFRDVVAHTATPRGSIYHHFPGGKAQLGVEAVALAGDFVDAAMDEAMRAAAGDPVTGFHSFLEWWSGVLEAEDFQAGCPVLAVAAESHPEAPQLAAAAAAAFGRWQHTLATALESAGMADGRARDLATLMVAAVEGAMVMCRAGADREPLVAVGRQIGLILEGAFGVQPAR